MTTNDVIVSPDRKTMVVISPDGSRRATMRSARADGFTDEQEKLARQFDIFSTTTPGEKRTVAKVTLLGRPVYLHLITGPPTWWLPRLSIERRKIGAGWLQLAAIVSWRDGE